MFQSVRTRRPKLNRFDLGHEKKLSCQMGDLIPILLQEVVPGDRFRNNTEIMMRFSPLLAPVMHRINVWTHFFFVPNRIVYDEWEDFITGGEDGTAAPVLPFYKSGAFHLNAGAGDGTLWDYLGLPSIASNAQVININALPFKGYTHIYNRWYRDQNLESSLTIPATSGEQTDWANVVLRKRAWEKDYFTSALPWAQRGNPISVVADLVYSDPALMKTSTSTFATGDDLQAKVGGASSAIQTEGSLRDIIIENLDSVGIDINALRTSNALQRFLETMARGGSRYAEQLLHIFGVRSSDARLQDPEYLGGGRQAVMVSEVLQTSESGTGTAQGTMVGHGLSVGSTNSFTKRFEEHGYVFGIMSVLPRTAYQNGVPRHFSYDDKFDYYFPQFAHLGEQAILEKEVYFDATDATHSTTWGYQERYTHMKYAPSTVHGDFRSSLDYWHLGRKFTGPPALNASFVQSDPTQRIFANTTPTDHKLWVQVYNNLSALRPMPYHADPRL